MIAVGGSGREASPRAGPGARDWHRPPDDELTDRVVRAYRAFARVGLFGGEGGGGAAAVPARPVVSGLWSTVLGLPEGLRPASTQRAGAALRLAVEMGLPTVGSSPSPAKVRASISCSRSGATGSDSESPHGGAAAAVEEPEASILRGLTDTSPSDSVVGAAGAGSKGRGGARVTKGALFYRRFADLVHDILLRKEGGGELLLAVLCCPTCTTLWPGSLGRCWPAGLFFSFVHLF